MTKSLVNKLILISCLSLFSTSAIAKNTYLDFKTYGNEVPKPVTPERIVNPPQTNGKVSLPVSTIKATAANLDFSFPLTVAGDITSPFGWRLDPFTGVPHLHEGVDFAVPIGTPVLAVANGEVAIAGNLNGYGLTVFLRHAQDTKESRYAHLSQIFVKSGEQIKKGTVIGLAGNTGLSTGPHLHFEWRELAQGTWIPTDPATLLLQARVKMLKAQTEQSVLQVKLSFKPDEYRRAPRHQAIRNLPLNFALNMPDQITTLLRRRFFGLPNFRDVLATLDLNESDRPVFLAKDRKYRT
ncbi:M23 family metallopeptidase [Gloeocapsa sp. PCC 73106]|uniref:M23 family metallopeptidase n=1 Tax=Gloeocapsa sp. PCC 73106 TaxID=102232 RepID=UPI0002AC48EE|nr:M23 family metallopeptidase [Gloeocapsa sp. PCC 73106]ELS00207.1 metalloendopeptidase-like membrane protein [Gloeocapsa sp. PCC 73106]